MLADALINPEAEAHVLGALMSDNRIADIAGDALSADDFGEALFGRIYQTAMTLIAQGKAANPVTLKTFFEQDEAMKQVGGPGFLAKLTSGPMLFGIRDIIAQVAELARRRRMVAEIELAKGELLAVQEDEDCAAIMSRLESAISIEEGRGEGITDTTAGDAFGQMLVEYEQPKHGVTCGRIAGLDDMLGPIRPGQMVILGGRPGMGKSAVALSYAIGAAQQGHGVLFVSLEMRAVDLVKRMTADLSFNGSSGIYYNIIRDGVKSGTMRNRVLDIGEQIERLPLHIIAAGGLKLGKLSSMIRRQQRRFQARGINLGLVVVDYLQLLHPDKRTNGPYEAVSEVSKALKEMAMRYNLGVMALAQLSRTVETRQDKRPMLSDLRDSGQIEQDADSIVFAYRDAYYLKQAEPPVNDPKRMEWQAGMERAEHALELIIAKRRDGVTGRVDAKFYGEYQAVRS